ncbi:cell wall-binding repeat-containing protein [Clostridium sp. DJ247]|uniref:cell wall-binding repeat-containing protein n=1 Tax=Clostridium sp. DJ247 TaxID=2726188 RepID=UPI00162AC84A|nr:cell wall-binding repeat-containing protein [Clostridium sp. DJ247]MBC2582737.1 cell wall-binding repeat-containing protein [Clostridium sp. DJ247]
MLKRNKKFVSYMLSMFVITNFIVFSSSKVSAASNRLWGQDRYATSVAISKEGWTSSDYVVIASGEDYADALCAAPLAKKYNAPILLTESADINDNVKQEIKRLNAKHVLIIGKYSSVSQNTENEIKTLVSDIKRLGGNDRYETSVIVAKELGNISGVTVTSGNGFADSLSIASIAAQKGMPILLTAKDKLPEVIKNYIEENNTNIKDSYIIGGQGVISDNIAEQVSKSSVRLYGQDRFETNLNVMKYFKQDLKFDNLYVVQADGPTGNEFADALSGSALAVKTSSPVILTYKTIPSATEKFIKENVKTKSNIIALGGVASVPEDIISTIQDDIDVSNIQQSPVVAGGGGSSTTTSESNDSDGDIQFIFADNSECSFNIYEKNGDTINIVDKISKNNLTKIKIYSSTAKPLTFSINGYKDNENLSSGWTDFEIPTAFIGFDSGDPGISQEGIDSLEPKSNMDGKFDFTVGYDEDVKSVVIKYK